MADSKQSYVLDNATTFLDGVEYHHGDTVELDPDHGKRLEEAGVAVPKSKWDAHQKDQARSGEDQTKDLAEAQKDADEAEQGKVNAAAAARAEQAAVPPTRRSRERGE